VARVTFTPAAKTLLEERTKRGRCARPVIRVMWLKKGWDTKRDANGGTVYFQEGYEGWSAALLDWEAAVTAPLRELWEVKHHEGLEVSFSSEVETYKGELIIDADGSHFGVRAA